MVNHAKRVETCHICASSAQDKWLCVRCQQALENLGLTSAMALPGGGIVRSCFRYEAPLRSVLLDAKVNGNLRSIRLLRHLWRQSRAVLELPPHVTAVMAAPSSLWGRLHGRTDLAALLAYDVAVSRGLPLLRAPAHLAWRMKKRARLGSKKTRGLSESLGTEPEGRPPSVKSDGFVILIDDVVTSGFTLSQLARSIDFESFACLTLGSAF